MSQSGSLGSGSPSPPGSSVYFQAQLTSNQTITNPNVSTIIYDTAISNQGSGYDVATGIFTAPSTGFYSFSVNTNFNISSPNMTGPIIGYTGSVQSLTLSEVSLNVVDTPLYGTSCAWSMPMTAGDTVKIQIFANGADSFDVVGHASSATAFTLASTFSGVGVA